MFILVTGGCGFIGSHVCEALVRAGHRVRVLDNLSSGFRHHLAAVADQVEVRLGDVRDAQTVFEACRGVEAVFHEAALVSVADSVARPRDNHDINVTGTLNVLEAARTQGARRVVLASSAAVYGNDPALPKRESMRPQPASPYAVAKLAGEHYLQVYRELYGMENVALRYFNVYGPRQSAGLAVFRCHLEICSMSSAGDSPHGVRGRTAIARFRLCEGCGAGQPGRPSRWTARRWSRCSMWLPAG
jgi:UDP-glucose 4-epimerase